MSFAFRCEVCAGDPTWRITRRGDAVVTWACDEDLYTVCHRLQRDWEITELVVVSHTKLREWREVRESLEAVAETPEVTG